MVKEAKAAKEATEAKVSIAIVTIAENVVANRGNAEVAQRRPQRRSL